MLYRDSRKAQAQITQAELLEYTTLRQTVKEAEKSFTVRLQAGASVEPGELVATYDVGESTRIPWQAAFEALTAKARELNIKRILRYAQAVVEEFGQPHPTRPRLVVKREVETRETA